MGICIGMGNYLPKHFFSEKEPKELKLTVHTSGESLIKMDPNMSVRGKSGRIFLVSGSPNPSCTMGASGVLDRELSPWVLMGFPLPLPFPLCLDLFLMGECMWF